MGTDQKNLRSGTMNTLLDLSLVSLFRRPSRIGVESAWYGHVPFGMWAVAQARPRLLVELGTHNGVSYSAFCDAVAAERLPTRCFAVDTWVGDEHSGLYGEEVFEDFSRFHNQRYRDFSNLLRMSFDGALSHFADGSIDLLHIDGLHTYAAVRRDFDQWLPKLSERAVVLLHDINVRKTKFGVWKLWHDLSQNYKSFDFLHSSGLGVLAVGSDTPESIQQLCRLAGADLARVREFFANLGERWEFESLCLLEREQLREVAGNYERSLKQLTSAYDSLQIEQERTITALNLSRKAADATLVTLNATRSQLERAIVERQTIQNSTFWRIAAPLRRFASALPHGIRHKLRYAVLSTLNPIRTVARAIGDLRRIRPAPRRRASDFSRDHSVRGHRVCLISGEPAIPGHTYRIIRLADAFRAIHASVSEWSLLEASTRVEDIMTCDIFYFWRVASCPEVDTLIATARRLGATVIFDIDDLMFEPELAREEIIDGIRTQALPATEIARHYRQIRKVLLSADFCTCSTAELATRIRALDKPAFVIPNGFDQASHAVSRLAVRRRSLGPADGLIRIGYAAGTRTHQRDFAVAADAVARILSETPDCRLVLFRDLNRLEPMLDLDEFPSLASCADKIEWRDMVLIADLPSEIARFDINLAPLETGNIFCEAKSELKYFEAALVEVCTVASPTGPMRRAIHDRKTGMLASTAEDWYTILHNLVNDSALRKKLGHYAYLDVLYRYGPHRRTEIALSLLEQTSGDRATAARAFEVELHRAHISQHGHIDLPESQVIFSNDNLKQSDITVVIPLYNYASYVENALNSVRSQSVQNIDLVVIDDASTDNSLDVVLAWMKREYRYFNKVCVYRNCSNSGLSRTRNVGFDAAETPFVVPLDADNRLLPDFCLKTLNAISETRAAFAYSKIQCFGSSDHIIGTEPFSATRFASGNYIDAMALVSKWAWVAVGGYEHIEYGWEDYDFWCKIVEKGLWGIHVPEILAEYRVHDQSMLRTMTDIPRNKFKIMDAMSARHPWLSLSYRV